MSWGRYSFHKFCDAREPCLTVLIACLYMRDGSMSLPLQRTFMFQRCSYTTQCLIVQLRLPIKLFSCFSLQRSGITAVCHPIQIILGFLFGFVLLDDPTHVLLGQYSTAEPQAQAFQDFFFQSRTVQMALWEKHLQCKHENPGSYLQNPCRNFQGV